MRARIVPCLLLAAALSGCRVFTMTTGEALSKFSGYENGLRVRALASIDQTWFIPERGVVFFGEVMPGRFIGDGIRINRDDEPPRARFVAGLSSKELRSRRPWLHPERFHRVKDNDAWCVETYFHGKRIESRVVDPNGASLWELRLEEQVIVVRSENDVQLRDSVRLGPRSGDWLYLFALPITLGVDVYRLVFPGTEPLDDCAALVAALFPPDAVVDEPLEARTPYGRPKLENPQPATKPVSADGKRSGSPSE